MNNWIWQGVLTSIIAAFIIFGGAMVLTWIKAKWPTYGDRALFWVASAAAIAVLWYTMTGYVPFAKKKFVVNTNNVESAIKMWMEDIGYSVARSNMADSYFSYTITTRDGNAIQVLRSSKEKTNYIQFGATLNAPSQIQVLMAGMTTDQLDSLTRELSIDLDKQRIGFSLASAVLPKTAAGTTPGSGQLIVVLQKGVPITELTEPVFAESLDDLNFAAQMVAAETPLIIKRLTTARTTSYATRTAGQSEK